MNRLPIPTDCFNPVSQLHKANFESYVEGIGDDGEEFEIFVAHEQSDFFGECIDLYNDGTYTHYSQFKEQELKFKFK